MRTVFDVGLLASGVAYILVTDPLAPEGLDLLRSRGHEVVDASGMGESERGDHVRRAEAWIVRSGTQLDADQLAAAPRLRAVGRAGVGVDNVDLEAATQAGVAVFNAPTGNITSAAEQAWTLMLAAARRVPEADASMKQETWLRKQLRGVELAGKTLFIVGLGRIGRMMARRAQAFEMQTIGYDPFVTPEAAKSFGVEAVSLDEGFLRADFVTLHTPLTPQTQHLVDAQRLQDAKPGMILVNAARGGLVDPQALLGALEDGTVAAAGIDVWEDEPPSDWSLAKHPRVVAAPHLGASTTEAQVKAATQACQRVCDFLDTGDAGLAINAVASVPDKLRPWALLAESLAGFSVQTLEGSLSEVVLCASPGLDVEALKVHALVGALRVGSESSVNAINAVALAEERGWTVATRVLPEEEDGERFLRLQLRASGRDTIIEGTFTPHYGARVTSLDGYDVEFRPRGRFLFTRHMDVPGVLARITSLLAEAQVNVASVSLARQDRDGSAVAVIRVDGSIPQSARDGLRGLSEVREAHRIRLI